MAIASSDTNTLITGHSSLNKEHYAELIHRNSPRAGAAFVSLNCAAVPNQQLASVLFRDIEGENNGAGAQGPIAAAEDGTLFLDEIHVLSLHSQLKLLRFIQEKEYRRVGETYVRRADLRLIGASTSHLPEAVRAGKFREDLLLCLSNLSVTPLPLWKRVVLFVRDLCLQLRQQLALGFGRPAVQTLPSKESAI